MPLAQRSHPAALALVLGLVAACGPEGTGDAPRAPATVVAPRSATRPALATKDQDAARAGTPEPVASAPTPADAPAQVEANDDAAAETPPAAPSPRPPLTRAQREVLQRAIDPLQEAAAARARHRTLPESRWIGEDQQSNQERIDELLDDVLEALSLGDASRTRQQLRTLEERRRALEEELVRAREQRLVAPPKEEIGQLQRFLVTSREEWDARVAELEAELRRVREDGVVLEDDFARELERVGLRLSPEAVRSLLDTVSGDSFLELMVVFDNVRNVTVQLQQLTEESGESLDAARRYYGCYVVLLELLDRLQKEFVRDVRERHQVALDDFERRAAENIEEAYRNERNGGDPDIAAQNVRANQLTLEATRLYRVYLEQQARAVEEQNATLGLRLADARNTLATVQLSSSVVHLLSEGRRQVEALVRLEVPELRGFENRELEREFARLTRELGRLD